MQTALANLIRDQLHFSSEEAQDNAQFLINAFDLEHKVVFWNKGAEHYFGITQQEAIGRRLEDVVSYAKENEKMQLLDRALRGTPIHVVNGQYDKIPAVYEQWILPVKKEGKTVAALNIVKTLTA